MNLEDARDKRRANINGEPLMPLFDTDELDRAESIVKALDGMTIDSANELLAKVSKSLTQLSVIHSKR